MGGELALAFGDEACGRILYRLPEPGGKGVLVRGLKVGVDATDREINDALYGNAPPGDSHLVIGHESFGIVDEVGPNVKRKKLRTAASLRA